MAVELLLFVVREVQNDLKDDPRQLRRGHFLEQNMTQEC